MVIAIKAFQSSVPKASKVPWDVKIARNQLLNRSLIDLCAILPINLTLSRNKYEVNEHLLATGSFFLFGVGMPLLLSWLFAKGITPKLIRNFQLGKNATPLNVPFEILEKNKLEFLRKNKRLPNELIKAGFTSIEQLTPKLANSILRAKCGIIAFDLVLLSIKGLIAGFGRNWLTEKSSKKQGFVGTFDYTSDDYRKLKSEKYERQKMNRLKINLLISAGFGSLVPLLTYAITKSPRKLGIGIIGKAKRMLPMLNYHNTIYMSKWIMLFGVLFNHNIPKILFSRDSHELRESVVKIAAFDFFYFFGDDFISSLLAKRLQKQNALKLKAAPLIEKVNRFGLDITAAVPYHKMFDKVGSQHLAFKLSKKIYWTGFLATTTAISIATPLINMWITKNKALREQTKMLKEKQKTPLSAPLIINTSYLYPNQYYQGVWTAN